MGLAGGNDRHSFRADGLQESAAVFGDVLRLISLERRKTEGVRGQRTDAAEPRAEGIGEPRLLERLADNVSKPRSSGRTFDLALPHAESILGGFERFFLYWLRRKFIGTIVIHR